MLVAAGTVLNWLDYLIIFCLIIIALVLARRIP